MAASRWTRKAFSSLNHSTPASVVVAHGTRSGAYDLLDAHAGDQESEVEAQPGSPRNAEETTVQSMFYKTSNASYSVIEGYRLCSTRELTM